MAKQEKPQIALFDKGNWYDEHWKEMPEFVQKDAMPHRTLFVHFENDADVEKFSQLIEQPITSKAKFVWFPQAEIGVVVNKRYVDALSVTHNEDAEEDES